MKIFRNTNNTIRFIRNTGAVAFISASLIMPTTASAGVLDTINSRVSSIYSRVNSIYSQVRSTQGQIYEIVESMNQTKNSLSSEGAKQMLDVVRSTLAFLEQSRDQYQRFSGPDDCGIGSPCNDYRDSLHGLIENVSSLPADLPFRGDFTSIADRLEKASQLMDRIPTFVLFASEQVAGDTIEKASDLLSELRSIVAEIPEIPTLEKLNTMADAEFHEVCSSVLDNPHIKLADVVLDNMAGYLSDFADFTQDNITFGITAVAGGTVSVKNPMKGTLQTVAFVVKTMKRQLNYSVALVNSVCKIAGYDEENVQ